MDVGIFLTWNKKVYKYSYLGGMKVRLPFRIRGSIPEDPEVAAILHKRLHTRMQAGEAMRNLGCYNWYTEQVGMTIFSWFHGFGYYQYQIVINISGDII